MHRGALAVFAVSSFAFVLPISIQGQQAPGSVPAGALALRLGTKDLQPTIAAQTQGGGRTGGQGTQGSGTQGGQQGQKPTPAQDDAPLWPDDAAMEAAFKWAKKQNGPTCIPGVNFRGTKPVKRGGAKPNVGPVPSLFQGGSESGRTIVVVGEGEVIRCSSYWVWHIGAGGQMELTPLNNGWLPFAGATVGLEHGFGSSAFALTPSFGFKIPFEPYNLKVFVDYRIAFYEGASEGGIGAGIGVIVPLKR